MKIIIPVSNNSENPDIAESLGRASHYMLYDTGTRVSNIIPNPAKDNPSGAGVKAAQTIVDTGAKVLLTIRCGNHAYEVLNGAGIKILSAFLGKAKENIDAYLEGNLLELDTVHEGNHRHGAN